MTSYSCSAISFSWKWKGVVACLFTSTHLGDLRRVFEFLSLLSVLLVGINDDFQFLKIFSWEKAKTSMMDSSTLPSTLFFFSSSSFFSFSPISFCSFLRNYTHTHTHIYVKISKHVFPGTRRKKKLFYNCTRL